MNTLRSAFTLLIVAVAAHADGQPSAATSSVPPNILLISIDDMRSWAGYLGHAQAQTPNLDRLARRGMSFTRSYCAAPLCNPSRTAVLTGLRPSHTGIYGNLHDWRTILPDVVTLPGHFRANGYFVAGAGKVFHAGYRRASDWDNFLATGKAADEKGDEVGGFLGSRALRGREEDMMDNKSVSHVLAQLEQKRDKPFFLACGIWKPHMPWIVPQRYFDLYSLDSIQVPKVLDTDLDDVPPAGREMAIDHHKGASRAGDHADVLKAGKWKEAIRAYLATISFADAMVGRLLDGIERSAHKDNTIICLWSDHGWHLGEKLHWRKSALWEEATCAPFIMVVPGVTRPGEACQRTTDLMNVYPTLCDLAGIPTPPHVNGVTLRPLLENPKAPWARAAVTTHEYRNHAVRTEEWRYIRYADGSEELYNEKDDPLEWKNLAGESRFAAVKAELARWLPVDDKPDAPRGKK